MLKPILFRIAMALPTLFGLLVLAFVLIYSVPADPAAALAGDNATPEQVAAIREKYGFDRPLYVQFAMYLHDVATLDFGVSAYSQRDVATDIAQRLPATLELTVSALIFASIFGIILGVIAATQHNKTPDFVTRLFATTGVAVASFWLAIMLQLLFSMKLGWLPLRGQLTSGVIPPDGPTGSVIVDSLLRGRWDVLGDALRHLILPALTLALGPMATIARFTRAAMLETLQKDFVLYERSVGYRRDRLIWRYALRNALITPITQIGLLFGALIAGAVVVESIFDWPGMGSYIVQAILTSDYKVMLASTLVIGVIYIAVNLVTDIVLGLVDHRLMHKA
ncbi:ABC transporter permease [Pseudorhodoplanes sp.]|uniref:ABC transporter permease n=1 Tax=Pseudorhodoplanes sp. TaxID=1934341 RepID=UPI003D0DEFE5